MTDLYFTAPSKEDFIDELPEFTGTNEFGETVLTTTKAFACDYVGNIELEQAIIDRDGEIVEPSIMSDYVCLNVRVVDDSLLKEFELTDVEQVYPDTPHAQWA